MKVKLLDTSSAGTWSRDCELLCISDCNGFRLSYHKDEDDTYWSLRCEGIIGYKVISEEFSTVGYLLNLPIEGAFFEILDSPWINELIDITKKKRF